MSLFEIVLNVLHFAIGFAGLVFAFIVEGEKEDGDEKRKKKWRLVIGAFATGLLVAFVVFIIGTTLTIRASADLEHRIRQVADGAGRSLTAEDLFGYVNKSLSPIASVTAKSELDALMNLVADGKLHPDIIELRAGNGDYHKVTVYQP